MVQLQFCIRYLAWCIRQQIFSFGTFRKSNNITNRICLTHDRYQPINSYVKKKTKKIRLTKLLKCFWFFTLTYLMQCHHVGGSPIPGLQLNVSNAPFRVLKCRSILFAADLHHGYELNRHQFHFHSELDHTLVIGIVQFVLCRKIAANADRLDEGQ